MNNTEEIKENEKNDSNNDNQKANMSAEDATAEAKVYEEAGKTDDGLIAELNDKYLRLYSEFDNFRKRTARERIELSKTAGEDIFKSLLPVMDDFERAIKAITEDSKAESVKEGISLIYNKLKKTLNQKGLEEMNAKGETFDSEIHEALTNMDAPSPDLKGKVIEEVEKGYLLNGKVIRHAKVVVGK
jgi:molecular chaperone GrpE